MTAETPNAETALAPAEPPRPVALEPLMGRPHEMLARATEMADALKVVIQRAGLVIPIQGRQYVTVEGWTVLCSMLQVFPKVEWTHKLEGDAIAYEARVALVHMGTGNVVSVAEAMASQAERKPWCGAEFSVRSMAQTRATGKAARLGFSWIIKMAGYEPTPAEEMPTEDGPPPPPKPRQARKREPEPPITEAEVLPDLPDEPPLAEEHPAPAPAGGPTYFSKSQGKPIPLRIMQTRHLEAIATKLRETLMTADQDEQGNDGGTLLAVQAELRRRAEAGER